MSAAGRTAKLLLTRLPGVLRNSPLGRTAVCRRADLLRVRMYVHTMASTDYYAGRSLFMQAAVQQLEERTTGGRVTSVCLPVL